MAAKYIYDDHWSHMFGSSLRCLFCPWLLPVGKFCCYWKMYAFKAHCIFIVSIHSCWHNAAENPAFDTTSITMDHWWLTVCFNNVCWKLSQKCNFLLILLKIKSSLSLKGVFVLDYLCVLSYGCRVSWWSLALALASAFPEPICASPSPRWRALQRRLKYLSRRLNQSNQCPI